MRDGSDFVYYSSVSSLVSVRCLCFAPNCANRRIASIDVRGAFNQSSTFEEMGMKDKYKYVVFTHPVTKKRLLFEARGPLYGEASAPRHWSDTLAEHLISEGFVRGLNETSTYYHPERQLTLLTYVDDLLICGEEPDLRFFEERLAARFDCKPMIVLGVTTNMLDHLGLEISEDDDGSRSISMESYIRAMPDIIGVPAKDLKFVSTPIASVIDPSTPQLSAAKRRTFLKACGCVSWVCACSRIDCQYALGRAAQHMSRPTESAYQAIMRTVSYLYHHAGMTLRAPKQPTLNSQRSHFAFYCDSDHSSDTSDDKLRCTCGLVCTLSGAPVLWSSTAPTVSCHALLKEPICDPAVCVSEIYAAGTAVQRILALSYAVEEMCLPDLQFPKPFVLQQDNVAAGLFSTRDGHSKARGRLKHIDLRQSFVQTMRDSNIMVSAWVDSRDNLSDILTKVLPVAEFQRQRDRLMHRKSEGPATASTCP